MQTLFCALSIFGIAYFSLAKRTFDWFAVAFFSACIYFLPGFFGFTSYFSLTEWIESPINDEAYWIMIVVEIMILSGAIISDLCSKEMNISEVERGNALVLNIILCFAIIGLVLMFLTAGTALFEVEKQFVMAELNRSHILFYTATIIGSTLSFEYKKWIIFACFCFFIIFDLFIGNRLSLAISLISIFTLWLSRQGRRRLLLCRWKQLLAGVLLATFLFFYKEIAYAVKAGDYDLLGSILCDANTYSTMFTTSEPFITQSILNEVTDRNYHVGMEHLMGLVYQLILYAPELGMGVTSFNDLFQNDLFREVDYGMANNIWAEMWSSGGWPLLFTFIFIFVIIIKLLCILTYSRKITKRAFVAVIASYWTFYIHRNDIGYEVSLEKRVLLVMGLAFLIAFTVRHLMSPQAIAKRTSRKGGDK